MWRARFRRWRVRRRVGNLRCIREHRMGFRRHPSRIRHHRRCIREHRRCLRDYHRRLRRPENLTLEVRLGPHNITNSNNPKNMPQWFLVPMDLYLPLMPMVRYPPLMPNLPLMAQDQRTLMPKDRHPLPKHSRSPRHIRRPRLCPTHPRPLHSPHPYVHPLPTFPFPSLPAKHHRSHRLP